MRTLARVSLVTAIGLGVGGCAERSARSAVETAENQIAAIRDEAQKVAPDRLKSLSDSLESIKSRLSGGDYRSVVMSARSISALTRDLEANMANTRSQLQTAFQSASNELPGQLDAAIAKVNQVAGLRRLPAGIDPAKFNTLQTESATWMDSWNKAKADFDAGNLAQAMSAVNSLRAKVREVGNLLGT
ncbi:MAG: hypothetical protein R2909_22580 [Gemmatimonadales bacterium]